MSILLFIWAYVQKMQTPRLILKIDKTLSVYVLHISRDKYTRNWTKHGNGKCRAFISLCGIVTRCSTLKSGGAVTTRHTAVTCTHAVPCHAYSYISTRNASWWILVTDNSQLAHCCDYRCDLLHLKYLMCNPHLTERAKSDQKLNHSYQDSAYLLSVLLQRINLDRLECCLTWQNMCECAHCT